MGKGKGIKDQRSDVGKSCGEVTFIRKLERWKERKQAQKEGMFPAGGSMVRPGKGVQAQAKVLQVELRGLQAERRGRRAGIPG